MSQQPDKLFRDKLYNLERPVSDQAWKRIAPARRPTFPMGYKVAATLLLLAVATFLILRPTHEPLEHVAVKGDSNTIIPSTGTDTAPEKVATDATPDKQSNAIALTEPTPPKKRQHKDTMVTDKKSMSANIASAKRKTEARPAVVPDTSSEDTPSIATTQATLAASEAIESIIPIDTPGRKPVIIVMDAEVVNEKYLSQDTNPEATTTAEETSSLRKLLDVAYDLKHNQDPIGELRQKKDEILAFNFKRGKERNEN